MLIRQGFKFELRPDGEQRRKMIRFAGACRFVFNHALALQRERHARGEKNSATPNSAKCSLSGNPIHRSLGCPRPTPNFSNRPSKTSNAHIRTSLPNELLFRASRRRGSVTVSAFRKATNSTSLTAESFSPIGWLRYRNSRDVMGNVKNVTVGQSAGKWFISIQTERHVEVRDTHQRRKSELTLVSRALLRSATVPWSSR